MLQSVSRMTRALPSYYIALFLAMEKKFWKYFAYGYLAVNTICLIMIFETIVLGKPYVSLFLLILSVTVYLNLKTFKSS